jgi:hypothetical protein
MTKHQTGGDTVTYTEPMHVELAYPRIEGNPDAIIVSLSDVRAADDLTIKYDFERDGWVISRDILDQLDDLQASEITEHIEVAFVPAWSDRNTQRRPGCHCYMWDEDCPQHPSHQPRTF